MGQRKFNHSTRDVSLVLVSRAKTVVDIIQEVVTNIISAKDIRIGQFVLPDDFKRSIQQVESLSNQTAYIKRQAENAAQASNDLFNAMSVSLSYFSFFHLHFLFTVLYNFTKTK
jgi:ribosomal protein L31E